MNDLESFLETQDLLPKMETEIKKSERARIIVEKSIKVQQEVENSTQQKQQKAPYFEVLFKYASKQEKRLIYFAYFCAIISGAVQPFQPIIVGLIVGEYTAVPPNTQKVLMYGVLMVAASFVILITVTAFYYILEMQSMQIVKKIKVAYLRSILKQDIEWCDNENAQELQTKMVQETQSIERMTGKLMGLNFMILGTSAFGILYAFLIAFPLSAIITLFFPLFFILTGIVRKKAEKGITVTFKDYQQSAGFAEQALNSIKVVCAFGQENTEIKNYERYLEKARKTSDKAVFSSSLAYGMGYFMMIMYICYAYTIGTIFITKDKINPNDGELYEGTDVWMCQGVLSMGVFSLFFLFPNLKAQAEGQVAGRLAFQTIERQPRIDIDREDCIKISELEEFKGKIEFKNVDFQYKNMSILKNFSAVIEEGKTTAIVGRSGSGKSTIINLIERFYDIDKGDLVIDGIDIRSLNLKDFRKLVGYVGQEPVLFNSTIKENLLYANPQATDEQVIQALKSANIYSFIKNDLKDGINTVVGNAGTQLSGGQKQRIAIARAFVKSAKLLLLDEATSALDSKNEKEVQAALDNIKSELGNITTVVVAHRLSTIRNADKIIVLDRGSIIEEGDHDSLLRQYPNGLYSRMVQEQQQATKNQPSPSLDYLTVPSSLTLSKNKKPKHEHSERLNNPKINAQTEIRSDVQGLTAVQRTKKLLSMSSIGYISIALCASIFAGGYYPSWGILNTHMLFVLEGNYGEKYQSGLAKLTLLMFVCLAFYILFFQSLKSYALDKIGVDLTFQFRRNLYEAILSKNMAWFDKRENAPGVLTSTMSKDATIVNAMGSQSLSVISDLVFSSLIGATLAMIYCWQIALISLCILPFYIAGSYCMMIYQKKIETIVNEAQADANLLSGDVIINYRTVASMSNEDEIAQDYARLLDAQNDKVGNHVFSVAFSFGLYKFGLMITYALILILSSVLLSNNTSISPERMFIAIMILVMTFVGLSNSSYYFGELSQANASADRIFSIIDHPSTINPLQLKQNPTKYREGLPSHRQDRQIIGSIEFKNVWFRYPMRQDNWILKDFNLKIEPNQSLALVGESGCGKSTVVQLLLRFYDPDFGEILVDGVKIQEFPLGDLRRQIGLVMQEPTLFNYTVAENILYGNGLASNEDILECSEKANILEFIDRFKDENDLSNIDQSYTLLKEELQIVKKEAIALQGEAKYFQILKNVEVLEATEIAQKGKIEDLTGCIDTRTKEQKGIKLGQGFQKGCGLKGNRLSGGQKQRVAIARAIIRKPQILLLDEATSSLDEESQTIVQRAIDKLMGERTTLVIAHRLSTVEKCHRIVLIKNGQVVEDGTLQQLKANKDSYYNAFALESVQA